MNHFKEILLIIKNTNSGQALGYQVLDREMQNVDTEFVYSGALRQAISELKNSNYISRDANDRGYILTTLGQNYIDTH